MSNFEGEEDKLDAYLDELVRKHKALDELISERFHNHTVTEEVRRLKTQKLWLKDEIYRIQRRLGELNGS